MSALNDQSSRDVIRSDTRRSLFVEAGAGTGKTSELVQRVVVLITGGEAELRSIVAITFTEAAAGELRERLRHGLEEASVDTDLTTNERQRCINALQQIDEAAIQTIHAFAQRLLRTHPTEAHLPPVFQVNDQVQARVSFRQRWHAFLTNTLASPLPIDDTVDDVLRTGLALGLKASHMRTLMTVLEQAWHDVPDFLASSPVTKPSVDPKLVVDAVTPAINEARGCTSDEDTLFKRITEQVCPWQMALEAATSKDLLSVLSVLGQAPSFTTSTQKMGKKTNWSTEARDRITDSFTATEEARTDALRKFQRWFLDHALRVLGQSVLQGVEARKRSGALEFHDLLVFARDLLRHNVVVRQKVRANYRYVFVDEFQDTDRLQAEIVDLLTQSQADDQSEPAQLFTVGDPKQSIYRFRKADPALFHAVRARSEGAVVHLNTNFRTLPAIVGWVNTCFAEMLDLTEDRSRIDLSAGRGEAEQGSVTLLGDQYSSKDMNTAELRRREAAEIVSTIVRAHEDGWAIQTSNGPRPASYSDIAVLMPTRTSLPGLERALNAEGVPYRIESRALIWATQELRDVLSIAQSIEDPHDKNALVAALRSPAFACSDLDLLEWKTAGGTWSYLAERPTTQSASPVAAAMTKLAALHARRWWCNVAEMVQVIIEDTHMFDIAYAHERQRESWARLRFVLDRARAWMEDGGSSLRAFLRWADVQTQEGADALESVVPETDDDAVRIMTVHASKGLEFPIVFVTGLNSTSNNSDSARLLWDSGHMPMVRLGSQTLEFQSHGFGELADVDKLEESREQARLAYVAVTRARDHLVLSLFRLERPCLAARRATVQEKLAPPLPAPQVLPGHTSKGETPSTSGRSAIDMIETGRSRVANAIAVGTRPLALSATAVARTIAGEYVSLPGPSLPLHGEPLSEQDQVRERLTFGTAVHAVLENSDLSQSVDTSMCVQVAEEAGFPHRAEEIEHCVDMALRSRPIQEAVRGRWWREVYVANEVGNLVIEGHADLVYEREDGLVVIDYKTDATPNAAAVERLMERYQWQLMTYAEALSRSLGKPVIEASLLLISPLNSKALVASVPDLHRSLETYRREVEYIRTHGQAAEARLP